MTRLRCAIYTRKSSEEGLEQSFNSLDAQREACEAYVLSQRSEGWSALGALYDDGGFSGGSMDRPALRRLLADIAAGRIDVVVVYKVDRLTRSLADFARIVDVFDSNGVSFVSVTQAFNTTTSMGRLTLNVLLSFAQFEREVTGERIRDKIAASKAKGMWMGGRAPFGYDHKDRELVPNPLEADTVRAIFARYLELRSVPKLIVALKEDGIRTGIRTMRDGRAHGGVPFHRGVLFHLLRNPVYIGQVVHRDKVYPGKHTPIIDTSTFEAVQALMGPAKRPANGNGPRSASPLAGLIFDADGFAMSPSHARGRRGGKYRYYVSTALLRDEPPPKDDIAIRRASGPAIEELVLGRLRRLSGMAAADWDRMRPFLRRVEIHPHAIILLIAPPEHAGWSDRVPAEDRYDLTTEGNLRLTVLARLQTRGGRTWLVDPHGGLAGRVSGLDQSLIKALRRAHLVVARHGIDVMGPAATLERARGMDDPNLRKLCKLAFLSPRIQQAIMDGRQPAGLTLDRILSTGVALSWADQESKLGFQP